MKHEIELYVSIVGDDVEIHGACAKCLKRAGIHVGGKIMEKRGLEDIKRVAKIRIEDVMENVECV